MATNIRDLDYENISEWPQAIKIAVVVITFLLILFLGYWIDGKSQARQLQTVKQQEQTQQRQLEANLKQAATLDFYAQEVAHMQAVFNKMIQRVPKTFQIPTLLEDISKLGVGNHLKFKLLRPERMQTHAFYADIPIQITVVGTYHQLALFISELANLNRPITFGNFAIQPDIQGDVKTEKIAELDENALLEMQLTASVYRYLEGGNSK